MTLHTQVERRGIRVAHLTTVHDSRDPRIFMKECRSLAAAGYEVHLLCCNTESRKTDGVTIVNVTEWSSRLSRMLLASVKIAFRTIRLKPRIAHVHDPELLLIVPLLRLMGISIVYDIHEDYITSIQQKRYIAKPLRFAMAAIFGGFEKVMAMMCHTVIAEEYYAERYPAACLVRNYPDVSKVRRIEGLSEAAMERKLGSKKTVLAYVGNITEDRGAFTQLSLLLDSADIELVYIGRCSQTLGDSIDKWLDEHLIDRGRFRVYGVGRYVPFGEIESILAREKPTVGLAVFPLTAHYERKLLTKFFDYLAWGLPVLVAPISTWKAFVEREKIGAAYQPGKLNAELEELERYVLDADFSSRAVKFTWESEFKNLASLYSSIVH